MLKRLRAQAQKTEQAKAEAASLIDVEIGETGRLMDGADIRLSKDLSEIYLPPQCTLTQVNGERDLKNLKVTIRPTSGPYKGGTFNFMFVFSPNYPFTPPKVSIVEKVYHPNLNTKGGVCLNVLREEYKPTLTMSTFVLGLLNLMLEPNSDDGLTKEICEAMRDMNQFHRDVRKAMSGGTIRLQGLDGIVTATTYDNVLRG